MGRQCSTRPIFYRTSLHEGYTRMLLMFAWTDAFVQASVLAFYNEQYQRPLAVCQGNTAASEKGLKFLAVGQVSVSIVIVLMYVAIFAITEGKVLTAKMRKRDSRIVAQSIQVGRRRRRRQSIDETDQSTG